MLLRHVSSIQTGLFAKPASHGDVMYLQAKHFDETGEMIATPQPDLVADGISEKHLLKQGDVLFAAKGTKNFASVFQQHNVAAIASTSFFVIKLTHDDVLPEYLAWFLNHEQVQSLLKQQALGSSIPSISKQVLENLEIAVPGIETQKAILHITKLRNREKSLKQEIETLRDKFINQQLIKVINHNL